MKIAAATGAQGPQNWPRPKQDRTRPADAAATAAPKGKIRHILHAWRLLEAPLVVQILSPGERDMPTVSAQRGTDNYRKAQAGTPAPHRLGDI